MADKLDEATLIIVSSNSVFEYFAKCNPISIIILLVWALRELWRKIFKHQNIFSEIKKINETRDC